MSERQKAQFAHRLASETCAAALAALSAPNDQHNDSMLLDSLISDYRGFLTLIYSAVTKIALSLKPSDPAYSASFTPLKDLASYVDSLTSCACCVDENLHGKTISNEIKWATTEVVTAVQALLSEFFTDDTQTTGSDSKAYLTRVGAVHEIIDRARGVSSCNREAVRKRWEANTTGLQDGVEEVIEMMEADGDRPAATLDNPEGDEANDEWGEFGLHGEKATDAELVRLKFTLSLLKMTHALHKRVLSSFLDPSSATAPRNLAELMSPHVLDNMMARSGELVAASDELVAALDPPQDTMSLSACLTSFRSTVNLMGEILITFSFTSQVKRDEVPHLPGIDGESLNDRMGAMNLQSDKGAKEVESSAEIKRAVKERKWFDFCLAQILKSCQQAIDASASKQDGK
ncbi:hypothetical protein BD410DRAFT_421482 [Rickenella mellea]|uniref:Cyclin-D1-binding protein 1-like N-terminal domain-containing protein n=1 Tax=Rickenella mellea TaxID=50990 RepID=A0A4Y7QIK6_9AGAM|nr:hypothetical protein BD410DRAFT_421482 [Rickenella mellea]